jgi:GT2 family glycosyltransferase
VSALVDGQTVQDVGVVILDFDQQILTLRCLRSVATGARIPTLIVLVENGHQRLDLGGHPDLAHLQIIVLHPGSNLGCSGGRNLGLDFMLRNTAIPMFVVLDNDAVVPPDFIERISVMKLPELQVAAPIISNLSDRAIWSCGGRTLPDGRVEQLRTRSTLDGRAAHVDWAPGACLVMARETWQQVGTFDPWMRFMFEDIEWCQRVRDAGGEIVVHPSLTLLHDANQSLGGMRSAKRTRLWARNGTVFRASVLRVRTGSIIVWVAGELLEAVRDFGVGHWSRSGARLSGLSAGIVEALRRTYRRRRASRPRR